jgi:hypothetical protein
MPGSARAIIKADPGGAGGIASNPDATPPSPLPRGRGNRDTGGYSLPGVGQPQHGAYHSAGQGDEAPEPTGRSTGCGRTCPRPAAARFRPGPARSRRASGSLKRRLSQPPAAPLALARRSAAGRSVRRRAPARQPSGWQSVDASLGWQPRLATRQTPTPRLAIPAANPPVAQPAPRSARWWFRAAAGCRPAADGLRCGAGSWGPSRWPLRPILAGHHPTCPGSSWPVGNVVTGLSLAVPLATWRNLIDAGQLSWLGVVTAGQADNSGLAAQHPATRWRLVVVNCGSGDRGDSCPAVTQSVRPTVRAKGIGLIRRVTLVVGADELRKTGRSRLKRRVATRGHWDRRAAEPTGELTDRLFQRWTRPGTRDDLGTGDGRASAQREAAERGRRTGTPADAPMSWRHRRTGRRRCGTGRAASGLSVAMPKGPGGAVR